jgi:hypothetical protein
MRKNSLSVPLIVEPHPGSYSGYPFITLIQYNDQKLLSITDNVINGTISAYILDFCGPAGIKEETLIRVADGWYSSGRYKTVPVSIEVSRLGLAQSFNAVYRAFPIDFVSRVIGPLPEYKMSGVSKIRRRKRKPLPPGVQYADLRRVRVSK